MNQTEERKIAERRMLIRKSTQAIRKSLKQASVDINGVGGTKNILSYLKIAKGNADNIDIHKPDEYGFYINRSGVRVCDNISILRDKLELEELEQIKKETGKSIDNIRFNHCGFPKNKKEREFILNHFFQDLSYLKSKFKEQWLFLYGGFGTGKTARSICLAWELIKSRYSQKVTFLTVGPWITAQMPSDGDLTNSELEIRNKFRRINGSNTNKIVILDDFDKFKTKSEFQANHLFNLIDQLKNRDCKVIITSNRSIQELESDCHAKLLPVLDRIKSRSFFSKFNGESLR